MNKVRSVLITVISLLAVLIYAVFFLNDGIPESKADGELIVTSIDIGQGDSKLIQQGDNAILIDSGEYSERKKLINTLDSLDLTSLDYVIATHPHTDHMGSLNVVIDTYDVKHIMMPNVTANTVSFEKLLESISKKNLRIERPVPGESVSAGNIKLDILAPNADKYANPNNYSIVARLEWGNTSFLFTGDAEALSEKEILDQGFNVSADVLNMGHHGSVSSTSDKFLDKVSPRIAVISRGIDNKYGHPHQETIDKLKEKNITVYDTATMGTITMRSDGTRITVTSEK